MLLPQSDAFKSLHARLHSVPTMALLKLEGGLLPLQESEPQSQDWPSPSKHGRASRQQSMRGRSSLDAGKPAQQLIDFDQLLQSFRQQQVQFQHAAMTAVKAWSIVMVKLVMIPTSRDSSRCWSPTECIL